MARARKFHPRVQASSCRAAPTPAGRSRSADRGGRALAPARRMYGRESSQLWMPPTRPSSITATAPEVEGRSCARRAIKAHGARSARRSRWRENALTNSQLDTTGLTSDARCFHKPLCVSFLSKQRLTSFTCCSCCIRGGRQRRARRSSLTIRCMARVMRPAKCNAEGEFLKLKLMYITDIKDKVRKHYLSTGGVNRSL